MSCFCGCPSLETIHQAVCDDATDFFCCLKMTGPGGVEFFRVTGPDNEVAMEHWAAGDDCEETSTPQLGGHSNICGGMYTVSPCTRQYPPFFLSWSPAGTDIFFKLITPTSERYTAFASPDWYSTGTPLTLGLYTITACDYNEPPPAIYNVCCWKYVLSIPGFPDEVRVTVKSLDGTYDCPTSLGGPRQYPYPPSEQCSKLPIGPNNTLYDPGPPIRRGVYAGGQLSLEYFVSKDYTTISISITGFGETSSIQTRPYTPTWFLTPIVATFPIYDPDGTATVTFSVCGYSITDPPCDGLPLDCFPACISNSQGENCDEPTHSLLFVNVSGPGSCCMDGDYDLPYSTVEDKYLTDPLNPIGGPAAVCGILELKLYCSAGTIRLEVRLTAPTGDISVSDFEIDLPCVDGNVSYSFTFATSSFLASTDYCAGTSGDVTVTIYSNN